MKRLGEEESPPRDAWDAAWELGDKDPCSGHTHLECSSPPLEQGGKGQVLAQPVQLSRAPRAFQRPCGSFVTHQLGLFLGSGTTELFTAPFLRWKPRFFHVTKSNLPSFCLTDPAFGVTSKRPQVIKIFPSFLLKSSVVFFTFGAVIHSEFICVSGSLAEVQSVPTKSPHHVLKSPR